MEHKDEQLNKLFDGYADDLNPRPELASSAREKLARKGEKKQKPLRRYGLIFGSLAAAVAVAVFAFGVLPTLLPRRSDGAINDGDHGGTTPAEPSALSYTIDDVRAVKTAKESVADYLDVSLIENAGYAIYADSYYGCYIKESGALAYVKAVFGVAAANGNIEISVIAELDGYKRKDLAEQYEYLIARGDRISYAKSYRDGEYMTMAYLTDYNIHYYVSTIGNADGAEEIFRYFL